MICEIRYISIVLCECYDSSCYSCNRGIPTGFYESLTILDKPGFFNAYRQIKLLRIGNQNVKPMKKEGDKKK